MRTIRNADPVTLEQKTVRMNLPATLPSVGISTNRKFVAGVLISFIAGFCVGLFLFGWWLWPVEWIYPEGLDFLDINQKTIIYESVAESLTFTNNTEQARLRVIIVDENFHKSICEVINNNQVTPESRARIIYLKYILGDSPCTTN